ncbi:hypothetical protein I4U23_015013 [Adineta vaga]|nr:hypothetical protein I4U23_015013 [Adineta vaga]
MSVVLRPFVGIGIIVVYPRRYPDCVLVSQRLASHGKGGYQLPGGHLEYVHVTNTMFSQDDGQSKHYVTLFMKTTIDDDSILKRMEPEKNSEWIWTKWNDLKTMKLFAPLEQAVNDANFNPFHES